LKPDKTLLDFHNLVANFFLFIHCFQIHKIALDQWINTDLDAARSSAVCCFVKN